MSFKFKIGDIVVPAAAQNAGLPVGPSRVTGLQLRGYVVIQPLGTPRRLLVEAKDYEKFEGDISEFGEENIATPPGWGIKAL